MATLPIHLEVEDIAVGPVLIALRKMPGIIKLHLALLDEPKPGRQDREPGGRASSRPAKAGENAERIVAYLMKHGGGPLGIKDIIQMLGSSKASAYTAMYALKKKKVVQSPSAGQYELTDKAKRELLPARETMKLLPKPHAAARAKASGRASPGAGPRLLLQALSGGALKREVLIKQLGESGMSEKSVTGIMARAKDAKLIKSVGNGAWELTAKGTNQQAADAATPATEA